MSFNITVEGGKSIRLPTAGKYCDRDIVVTSTGGEVVEPIIEPLEVTENGTYTPPVEIDGYNPVTVNVPLRYDEGYNDGFSEGKKDGYNEGYQASQDSIILQEKTVDITENGSTEVAPDDGKYLSKVTVEVDVPIPDGYIVPSGTMEITENGTHDVTEYAFVDVQTSGEADTTDYLGLLITQKLENVYSDIGGTLLPYAFYENEGVTTIELPNIEYLKERCFYSCGNLNTLKLPGLVGYTYQYMASGCSELVDVDIHNSNYISSYSFQNCTSLKELVLHKVENIATNAFVGATKFETLILRVDAVPTLGGTNAFTNTKIKSGGTGYIYVPKALIEEYKSATNWSSFASQFRAIEDYPDIYGG